MMKKILTIAVLFLLLGCLAWIFFHFGLKKEKKTVIAEPPPKMKFGLPVDSFLIEQAKVIKNQCLSDILSGHGVSFQTVDLMARASLPVFDVRGMRTGNNCYFFSSKSSPARLQYFIYEIDQINYVIYDLTDSIYCFKGQKPVTKKIRTASAVITSSLWNAMGDNDLDPMLALKLNDIYQWTVDFFGIQKGDQFRVLFEESFVDSTSVGVTNVYACEFKHAKENFYAFRFAQNDTVRYYNEKGESLQKAFLKAPLKFSRISSHFSYSRFHPVLKIRRPHLGVDYAAMRGTPVHSIGDGVVVRKGYQANGGGNFLYIKHNSAFTTSYMHLDGFASGIAPGVRVKQGQLIGYVGSTGLATGPHLDFRVFRNGNPVDPLKLSAEPGKPVSRKYLSGFIEMKDSLLTELRKIRINENPDGYTPAIAQNGNNQAKKGS